MPNVQWKGPDGKQYRATFPDDWSQDRIMSKARELTNLAPKNNAESTPPSTSDSAPEDQSTFDRVASTALKYGDTLSNTVKSSIFGKEGADVAGFGLVNDLVAAVPRLAANLVSNALGSEEETPVFETTNKLTKFIKENAKDASELEQLAGTVTATVLDPINFALAGANIGKDLPRVKRLLETVKFGATRGAPVAAAQDAANQMAQSGELDVIRSSIATGAGLAGPAIAEGLFQLGAIGGKALSKAGQKIGERSVEKAGKLTAKQIARVAREADAGLAEGLNPERALARAFERTNLGARPYWDTVFGMKDTVKTGASKAVPKESFASTLADETVQTADDLFYEAIDKGLKISRKVGKGKLKGSNMYEAAAKQWRSLSESAQPLTKHFDNWFARSTATQAEQIHPAVGRAFRWMEMTRAEMIGQDSQAVMRWRSAVRALPRNVQDELGLALSNGKEEEAKNIMRAWANHPKVQRALGQADVKLNKWKAQGGPKAWGDPWTGTNPPRNAFGTAAKAPPAPKGDFSTEFDTAVRDNLDEIFLRLHGSAAGKPLGYTKGYFPRIMKDRKGFLKNTTRGRRIADKVDDLFDREQKRLGRVLTPEEETDVILKELTKGSGSKPLPPKAASENKRVITELTPEEYKYFHRPSEALENYIYTSNEVAAFRQTLGYGGSPSEQISKIVADLYGAGEITKPQVKELATLLQARIGSGTQPTHAFLRGLKNVFYATTLTNPGSAAVQIADMGLSAVMNGIKPTVKAVARSVAKANNLPDIDATETFDLVRATAEMMDNKSMGAHLQRMFHWSGFSTVDKLGKNVNIQSTLNKARDLAKRPDYIEALENQFGRGIFSRNEWDEVAKALRAGKVTDNVKFLTWNALSDTQPISLSEMPLAYLQNPNGRILYAMKSYMLKQLDLMRKKGFDLLASPGRRAEGAAFLMRYGAYLGGLNLGVEDIRANLMGREWDRGDSLLDDVAWSALKGLGMSSYFANQVSQAYEARDFGSLAEALVGVPAVTHAFDLLSNAFKAVNPNEGQEEDNSKRYEIVRNFPLLGPLLHNYFLGGRNAFQEWQERVAEERDD